MMPFTDLLAFLLPIYVANSSPVVLGGGEPLDFGISLRDGERLLGSGKTVRGFIGGALAGTFAAGILSLFWLLPFFPTPAVQFVAGSAMAIGTLAGDALGSFVKRRAHVGSGSPFVLDTSAFLIVALAFAMPFTSASLFEPANLLVFLILTLILHPMTNFFANRAGLKNVPW
jgi:CDP-2,3-bis-(O-geranylgeranyl)-sn-glycerol synthase